MICLQEIRNQILEELHVKSVDTIWEEFSKKQRAYLGGVCGGILQKILWRILGSFSYFFLLKNFWSILFHILEKTLGEYIKIFLKVSLEEFVEYTLEKFLKEYAIVQRDSREIHRELLKESIEGFLEESLELQLFSEELE